MVKVGPGHRPQSRISTGDATSTNQATQAQEVAEVKKLDPTLADGVDGCGPGAAEALLANQVAANVAVQTGGDPFSVYGALPSPTNPHALPAAAYFSPEEVGRTLNHMHGPGAAPLFMRAEAALMSSHQAFAAALMGADHAALTQIFGGPNVPGAANMASLIQNVVRQLQAQPINMAALQQSILQAEAGLIPYLTPNGGPERAQLEGLFQSQYGISPHATGQYAGQGALGSQVQQNLPPGSQFPDVPPAPDGRPTAPGAAGAVQVASSQIGVREATGNNDGIPSQRYAHGRNVPWCAYFVDYSFKKAGVQIPGKTMAKGSVQYMEDQVKKAARETPDKWAYVNSGAGQPQKGDIIFFKNRGDSDRGGGRHVGIVDRVENGRVYTIEGNSSNGVRKRSYPMNHPRVAGYGRSLA
jgi:cell wall-associated NlpC family hydrolase